MNRIEIERPGTVPYATGWDWQREHAATLRARGPEALVVLQHTPVYTLGLRGDRGNILATEAWIAGRGAEVIQSDRGGDVTFHGPGQLVAYPILDIRARELGPATYVRMLEESVIATLAAFGIEGARVARRPGIRADCGSAKIAAVGVRIRDGVSMHGLALNVSTDLEWFEAIVPCGITDAGVTSMQRLAGATPPHDAVEDAFIASFACVFDASLVGDPAPLGAGSR
jgi:lipoate-protein ligase B